MAGCQAENTAGLAMRLLAVRSPARFMAVLAGTILVPGIAMAEVTCPPSYVSGTTPLPQCLQLIQNTAPGAQAAIFGAQQVGAQSNAVLLDRMTDLRQQTQTSLSQPLGYAGTVGEEALAYTKSRKPNDPISPRLVTKAPPAPTGPTVRPAVWLRGFGDFEDRNGSFSMLTPGGVALIDQGYRSAIGGVMGGGDLVISRLTSPSDALILGAMGGYINAQINVNAGRHRLEGGTFGGYGTYLSGAFFWDALVKVDLLGFSTSVPFMTPSADLTNFNVLSNIGYKFDLPSKWYVEPTVGIEYVQSKWTNQQIIATTFTTLDNAHMTRGRFGARIGTEWISNNVRIEPSVLLLGYYYFEATGATVQLGAAGGSIVLPTDQGKFRGEIQPGVNFFDLSSGWSGYVRGDFRFQEDLVGGGGKVGIRYQW